MPPDRYLFYLSVVKHILKPNHCIQVLLPPRQYVRDCSECRLIVWRTGNEPF